MLSVIICIDVKTDLIPKVSGSWRSTQFTLDRLQRKKKCCWNQGTSPCSHSALLLCSVPEPLLESGRATKRLFCTALLQHTWASDQMLSLKLSWPELWFEAEGDDSFPSKHALLSLGSKSQDNPKEILCWATRQHWPPECMHKEDKAGPSWHSGDSADWSTDRGREASLNPKKFLEWDC